MESIGIAAKVRHLVPFCDEESFSLVANKGKQRQGWPKYKDREIESPSGTVRLLVIKFITQKTYLFKRTN